MSNRLNRYISATFITTFLLVIIVFSVLNFSNILLKGEEISLLYQQANYSKEFFSGLDDLYRDNFIKKEKWIDIYGLVQKLFQRRIIGSMEFAKNDDGLMEIIHLNKMGDGKSFADSLVELNQICNKFDTEFMYIQMPIRNDGSVPNALIDLDNYYDDINENIKNENIWQVSGEYILEQGEFSLTDLYLKTDIHLTTEGEMYMAQMISEKLSEKNIKIQNVISGVNDDSYSNHSHKLLGNLVRSAASIIMGRIRLTNIYLKMIVTQSLNCLI